MSTDLCLGMAIALFTLFIAWRLYHTRSKQLTALVALFAAMGLAYSLLGYTVLDLLISLSICSIACIGIVSALRLAIHGPEARLLIGFAPPKFRGLISGLYRGVLSYTLLFVSSVAIAALLSVAVGNLFARLSIAIVLSFIVSYVLKHIGRLWIALTAFIVLALAAYIVAPNTIVSDLRSFDEWLKLLEVVIGGVG